jgi:hypothetical protein
MAHNKWPKQVLEWMRTGRSKMRRPTARWMEGIQDAMAEKGEEEG